MSRIRIGTRGSALALWQAEHVKARLSALGHEIELRVITTTGDRLLDRRLESVGGKGAFLKEIEDAVPGRHDHPYLDLVAERRESRLHVVRLPQGEGAAARADADPAHRPKSFRIRPTCSG